MAPASVQPPKPPPKTVSDFIVLPLALSSLPGLPASCTAAYHYLYVKPHSPSVPGPDDERSLFLANVPVDADEGLLRALFKEQLGGAMVERVEFERDIGGKRKAAMDANANGSGSVITESGERAKKRKRSAMDESVIAQGVIEDETTALPRLWNRDLRRSGSTAILVFVDRKSCRGAMASVKQLVKAGSISGNKDHAIWKASGEGYGVERYKSHLALLHPAPPLLHSTTTAYLTQFTALEKAHHAICRTQRTLPDADGFTTVTRGARVGPARIDAAIRQKKELDERRAAVAKDDFYRFQNRERRKEREGELRRRFEEDRRRVEGLRGRRGGVRPEV